MCTSRYKLTSVTSHLKYIILAFLMKNIKVWFSVQNIQIWTFLVIKVNLKFVEYIFYIDAIFVQENANIFCLCPSLPIIFLR
jgi:hypothetical protein